MARGQAVSVGDFALLLVAAVVWQEFYARLTMRYFRRCLSPLSAWLGGDRGRESTVAAWQAAASMPFDLLSDDLGGWEERPPVALKGKAQEVRLYGSRALERGSTGATLDRV